MGFWGWVGLPPAPAVPRPPVAPAEVAAGARTENLESWQPGESANARQDPRFPDSQLADSRSLPATAAAGLRLADAVIALGPPDLIQTAGADGRQPPRRAVKGAWAPSCAIVTMPANELLAEMHNAKQRMPLILPPEAGISG